MLLGLSLKLFWRELKSGQLSIMFFALVLAVATVSSISLFTDRLEKALLAETQEFLGGDLKFESNDLIEDEPYEEIQKLNFKNLKPLKLSLKVLLILLFLDRFYRSYLKTFSMHCIFAIYFNT